MRDMLMRFQWLIKNIAVYPILFAVDEILLLAAPNMANVKLAETVLPMILYGVVAAAFLWACAFWFKSLHRAGLIVLVSLIWFGRYGLVAQLVDGMPGIEVNALVHILLFIVWSAFFGFFASSWLWRKVTRPEIITQYFNLLMPILLLFSISRIATYQMGRIEPEAASQGKDELIELSASTQPDIYYIIADGYGREDVLLELYGLDDDSFYQALKERGFFVAEKSHSNYVRTLLSLASSLNLDYLPALPVNSSDVGPLQDMMANNLMQQSLEASGYKTTVLNSGIFIEPKRVLEGLFWLNSVAALPIDLNLISSPLPKNREQQTVIMEQVAHLEEVSSQSGPKYVYVHILIPHPPFIFDHDGPVAPEEVYRLSDGENFPGTPEEYIQGYKEQLLFANKLLLQAVDTILENNPTPPVIVLQGDHGGGAYLNPAGWEKSCMMERFSILNAYYLPGFPIDQLYPEVTPVNSYRLIFNHYFDTDFDLLPDESYYSPAQLPYKLTRVSDFLAQPCQVP